MMRNAIHAKNVEGAVPVQVRWLAGPHSKKQRREKGKNSASSVVFLEMGC